MNWKKFLGTLFAGGAAGGINGLFGTGGGLVLVPCLNRYTELEEEQVFPCSVSIILPICIVSVCMNMDQNMYQLHGAQWYLLGGILGGTCAGFLGRYIPTKYLHRTLGFMILWGGLRYLC